MLFFVLFTVFSFLLFCSFFFFNDTATTEIYTLSLHDALPISTSSRRRGSSRAPPAYGATRWRSEEHTSELQSRRDLVCRLLLEKKKNNIYPRYTNTELMSTKRDEMKVKTL